jgi:hypothetical protein
MRANQQTHDGITADEYIAALDVPRRMTANLGGNIGLP